MIELLGSEKASELFLNSKLIYVYFGIMWILFSYVFYKYKVNKWTVFVVLLFTPNFFQYIGFDGLYKITLTCYTIFLFHISKAYTLLYKYKVINVFFIGWSLFFFISCFNNRVSYLMTFSQYGIKYLFIYLIFFICCSLQYKLTIKERIYKIVLYCLFLQSILSILKYILWGVLGEALVGSLTTNGGGPNNIIPIVGFLIVWTHNKGNLSKKDWAFCLFLLISPIFGGKRSIWFFYVFVVGSTLLFVHNTKWQSKIRRIILTTPILLFVIIIGVKLNPSLNPEKKMGGSFDLDYVINYSSNYLFGDEDSRSGRGGATISLFENNSLQKIPMFGYGLDIMKTDYENFDNDLLEVKSKGEIGAAIGNLYSFGMLSSCLLLAFMLSVLWQIKIIKLKYIVITFMLIEYIIFYNVLMMSQPMLFVLLFAQFSIINTCIITKKTKSTLG